MSNIISISLSNDDLEKINTIQSKGYSGRSEVVRNALQLLLSEEKNKEKLSGDIDAVLLVKHKESYSQSIMKIQHDYQSLIKTHLHTHLDNHTCLELFMLKGSAVKIKNLVDAYNTSKKTIFVKLIIS